MQDNKHNRHDTSHKKCFSTVEQLLGSVANLCKIILLQERMW